MEELLHAETEDGLLLEGVRYGPASSELAVVYTHGITGSVFRPAHVRLGRAVAQDGFTVVAGNNRGTGLATAIPQRSGTRFLAGSWFERLDRATTDIAAWMDVAAAAGARRIVLLGHSLGAAKAVLYASERGDPRLVGLVLASPAFRLAAWAVDPDLAARAGQAVAQGRSDELIEVPLVLTFGRLSAATVLDYASGRLDPWNERSPRLGAIGCPVLAFYGTAEPDIGGQAELERIARLVRGPFAANMITDANHLYVGHEDAAASVVTTWLRAVVAPSRSREPAPAD